MSDPATMREHIERLHTLGMARIELLQIIEDEAALIMGDAFEGPKAAFKVDPTDNDFKDEA